MRRIILMFFANLFRLPYMLYKLFHMTAHKDRFNKSARYSCLHRFVRWANWGGRVKVTAFGVENIPTDSGFIMYPNHQGLYDTLTMVESLEVPFSPIAKIEIKTVFLLHNAVDMLDGEYMDRHNIKQSVEIIHRMAERVKKGENFVIFAEGTRSKKGNEMLPFKAGSFKAAVLAHAPIVPVALIDCFVPFDRPSLKKITVQAHYLKPITYNEYKSLNTHEIADLVQTRIRDCIAAYAAG